jgi:hypothetical protein
MCPISFELLQIIKPCRKPSASLACPCTPSPPPTSPPPPCPPPPPTPPAAPLAVALVVGHTPPFPNPEQGLQLCNRKIPLTSHALPNAWTLPQILLCPKSCAPHHQDPRPWCSLCTWCSRWGCSRGWPFPSLRYLPDQSTQLCLPSQTLESVTPFLSLRGSSGLGQIDGGLRRGLSCGLRHGLRRGLATGLAARAVPSCRLEPTLEMRQCTSQRGPAWGQPGWAPRLHLGTAPLGPASRGRGRQSRKNGRPNRNRVPRASGPRPTKAQGPEARRS